ncbi:MAG: hypothetical protein GC165_03850 [Armatimonadetes bacterium]|nr:hypothetical protein [Armatimonadota bacterium]MBS1727488.1 hypothetical protein [Armatimonadota bacterium]
MKVFRIWGLVAGLALAGSTLADGQVPIVKAHRLDKAPTIDGKMNPGEWDEAFETSTFLDRATTKPPSDKTEAWIGYDRKGIYIAFYCHDSQPDKIVAREIIPNSKFDGEDWVEFDINPFGNRTFNQLCEFVVNARGTKSENFKGGRTDKREWRGDWKAATSRTSDGWVCEMEIPWPILNYPRKDRFNMDLNLIRGQGRSQIEQSWANARLNPLPEQQGIWEGVEPPTPPTAHVQYLAYSAPEVANGKFQNRVGLDARYAFTQSVTGVMSLAPDFKNIQDVVPGIDFVRTERNLDESRPFFNEGSGFFRLTDNFTYGSMFYSRRIADFDMGAKVYGQANPNLGFGALYTNKFDGEKAAVFNVKRTFSSTEGINLFGTVNADGNDNSSLGFGYNKRVGKIGFDVGAAMEKDNGTKADTAGSAAISYQGNGDFLMARYLWVTPEFNPSLAYIPWTDRRGGYIYGESNRQYRKGPIRETQYNFSTDQFRTYSGVLQENGFDTSFNVGLRNDMGVGFARVRYTYSGSLDDYWVYGIAFNTSNRFKKLSMNYLQGTQGDMPSKYYFVRGSYRVVNNLDLSIDKSVQELGGTTRQTIATLAYQASPQDLLSSRFVMNGNDQNIYFSFRHAGFRGTEYYLIYGDPNAQRTSNRLSLKAVWAF